MYYLKFLYIAEEEPHQMIHSLANTLSEALPADQMVPYQLPKWYHVRLFHLM